MGWAARAWRGGYGSGGQFLLANQQPQQSCRSCRSVSIWRTWMSISQAATTMTLFAAFISYLLTFPVIAGSHGKILPEAEIVNELRAIGQADLPKLSGPLVVDGNMLFNGGFIAADKVVFRSGAKLIFSLQAQDRRRNFYIVTKEISSEDANAPGIITYEQPPATIAAPTAGRAPSGAAGWHEGISGAPGQPGSKGTQGPKGNAAPSLTITVLSVSAPGPSIDFRGGPGGKGGRGQKGGDGGPGAKGSPASRSLFDCVSGAGSGGNGGPGGPGGPGGDGGIGGDGGTVKIIASAELLPSLSQKLRVVVSGGPGGSPGDGGNGGYPGAGGPGGQDARPYCRGGPVGSAGAAGERGPIGEPGGQGVEGDYLVGAITPELFTRVYK
jgi:hypothetical protein